MDFLGFLVTALIPGDVCTCSAGYWGPGCEGECPGGAMTPCAGHGTCADGAAGTGQCDCQYGYFGAACNNECVGGASVCIGAYMSLSYAVPGASEKPFHSKLSDPRNCPYPLFPKENHLRISNAA